MPLASNATARRLDEETGLYYYRARMYDPTLGRFLQPDPIGIAGGVNLYRYVGNMPTGFIDPYGLVNWGTVGQGGLALIGGGVGVVISIPTSGTGIGAIVAVPVAITGSTVFAWGVAQIIAGLNDGEIPFPEPTFDYLAALLLTQNPDTAAEIHSWFDFIMALININKILNNSEIPSKIENIEAISDLTGATIDISDWIDEDSNQSDLK